MKYDTNTKGRGSRAFSNTLPANHRAPQEWAHCDILNAQRPEGTNWEWAPTSAIFEDDSIQPRTADPIDYRLVEQYAEAFEFLPPIIVQKDTWRIVDGRHRYHATGGRDGRLDRNWMRIVELDVPDAELIDHAVKANVGHGRGASAADRTFWAKDFLQRHPDWSDTRIAEWTGASSRTIYDLRGKMTARNERAGSLPQIAGVVPEKRLGRDGVYRPVSSPPPGARSQATRPETARDMRHEPLSRTPEPNYFDPDEWGESDAVAPDFDEPARQVLEEIGYASVGPPEGERPDTGAFAGEVAWPGAAEAARKLDALEPRATATNYVEVRQPVFQAWMDAVLMLGDVPEGGTEKQYRYAANVFEALRADCLKFVGGA